MQKPHSPEDQLAILLGQRQLVAICAMALTVLGLVATLAYVAGRSITAAQIQQQSASERESVNQRPALVVDSAAPAPSSPLQAQAAAMIAPRPAVPVRPAPVEKPANEARAETDPRAGETYWQIGLVDQQLATVFLKRMQSLDLPARVATGTSPATKRVLVGPLSSLAEIERVKQVLDGAGLQAFLRKY